MAVNKVVFDNSTLIDLTSDTVTAENLVSGITAHSKSGAVVTGTLVVANIYSGASEPAASVGKNGDLYLVIGG